MALYGKLRPGPGRTAEEVASHQCRRIHGAMIQIAGARGYDAVTVRGLTRAAAVSTHTFYEHFEGKEDCFLRTYDLVARFAARRLVAALRRADGDWGEQVRVGIRELVGMLAEEPEAARLCLLEAFAAGPRARERLRHTEAMLETILREAVDADPGAAAIPSSSIRGIVGGAMSIGRMALRTGKEPDLPALAEGIEAWVLCYPTDSQATQLLQAPRPAVRQASAPARKKNLEIADERGRILSTTTRLATAKGYGGLTVARIREQAGVSRKAFETHFGSIEACFLAAVERVLTEGIERAWQEASVGRTWPEQTCRLASAFCCQIARDTTLARLGFAEVLEPGTEGARCCERFIVTTADRLRHCAPRPQQPSRLAARSSIGGAWSTIHDYVIADQALQLPYQAASLSFLILAPAVGAPLAAETIRAEQSYETSSLKT